jgi:hypothetical protein
MQNERPKFIHGTDIVEAIRASLGDTDRADFAVAYWGKNAGAILGLDNFEKEVRIICDLWSFACNPKELAKLLSRGFKLKKQDGLHAKVYITKKTLVVGSANASINGLGEDGEEDFNLEAAVVSTDNHLIESANVWFDDHWENATEIDNVLLAKYTEQWKRNQPKTKYVLRALTESPDTIVRLPISLVVFENEDTWELLEKAWELLKDEYSPDELQHINNYGAVIFPFYLDHRRTFCPTPYMVNYWANMDAPRSFSLDDSGGVWKFKKEKWIDLNGNGKKTKALLYDLVRGIRGWKFPDTDYHGALYSCVCEYVNRTEISRRNVLLDVPLSSLPDKYPTIFKALKRRLRGKAART